MDLPMLGLGRSLATPPGGVTADVERPDDVSYGFTVDAVINANKTTWGLESFDIVSIDDLKKHAVEKG